MKKVLVKLSPEAEEVYNKLNVESANSKTERMILKAVKQKVELIKSNPHLGNPVAKKLFLMSTNLNRELRIYFVLNYLLSGECCIL